MKYYQNSGSCYLLILFVILTLLPNCTKNKDATMGKSGKVYVRLYDKINGAHSNLSFGTSIKPDGSYTKVSAQTFTIQYTLTNVLNIQPTIPNYLPIYEDYNVSGTIPIYDEPGTLGKDGNDRYYTINAKYDTSTYQTTNFQNIPIKVYNYVDKSDVSYSNTPEGSSSSGNSNGTTGNTIDNTPDYLTFKYDYYNQGKFQYTHNFEASDPHWTSKYKDKDNQNVYTLNNGLGRIIAGNDKTYSAYSLQIWIISYQSTVPYLYSVDKLTSWPYQTSENSIIFTTAWHYWADVGSNATVNITSDKNGVISGNFSGINVYLEGDGPNSWAHNSTNDYFVISNGKFKLRLNDNVK